MLKAKHKSSTLIKDYLISVLVSAVLIVSIVSVNKGNIIIIKTTNTINPMDTFSFSNPSVNIDISKQNNYLKGIYLLSNKQDDNYQAFSTDSMLWCENVVMSKFLNNASNTGKTYLGNYIESGFRINSNKLTLNNGLGNYFTWRTTKGQILGEGFKHNADFNKLNFLPDTLLLDIEADMYVFRSEIWLVKE